VGWTGAIVLIAICSPFSALSSGTQITISDLDVGSHVWWRRTRTIPWNEVSGIEKSSSGEIQVFGKNGQCIGFTSRHVDPWRFQDEVMRRAKLNPVIDALAPLSLRI
jgi:hypothetical protein